jgi:hypothetical protein
MPAMLFLLWQPVQTPAGLQADNKKKQKCSRVFTARVLQLLLTCMGKPWMTPQVHNCS